MPDIADENAVAEIFGIALPAIVNAVVSPITDVGGNAADVLDLLESVAAAVLAFTIKPEGDAAVLATFQRHVADKLALVRLGGMETAGSG